jgi:hypothetical protein
MATIVLAGKPTSLLSRSWRGPPGHKHGGKTKQDQSQRNRAPPVLPEGTKTMAGLAPCPEDADKQDNDTRDLASSTHSRKHYPCGPRSRRRLRTYSTIRGFACYPLQLRSGTDICSRCA